MNDVIAFIIIVGGYLISMTAGVVIVALIAPFIAKHLWYFWRWIQNDDN